jgi:hypothetical protein
MVALYAPWYNFIRIHKTPRTSPAMAAGIETRLWSMEDVVWLIDENVERASAGGSICRLNAKAPQRGALVGRGNVEDVPT